MEGFMAAAQGYMVFASSMLLFIILIILAIAAFFGMIVKVKQSILSLSVEKRMQALAWEIHNETRWLRPTDDTELTIESVLKYVMTCIHNEVRIDGSKIREIATGDTVVYQRSDIMDCELIPVTLAALLLRQDISLDRYHEMTPEEFKALRKKDEEETSSHERRNWIESKGEKG